MGSVEGSVPQNYMFGTVQSGVGKMAENQISIAAEFDFRSVVIYFPKWLAGTKPQLPTIFNWCILKKLSHFCVA